MADEVGLGKTIMAREVISRVRNMRRQVNDDMFRVVYVCSNMNIVRQNMNNLGVKEKLEVSESRLSMQHLIISQKDKELKAKYGTDMSEMLIPLTPGTSFSQHGSGVGNIPERALLFAVLSRLDAFSDSKDKLEIFLRSKYVKEDSGSWNDYVKKYNTAVDKLGNEYIDNIKKELDKNTDYCSLESEIVEINPDKENWTSRHNEIINSLRRIFADMSLSMLKPDLILMDEFQRFSSLLNYDDDSEQSAIVKKFFDHDGGQQPLILLLSATPYKPYSTLEELAEYNTDAHYEDFTRLMDFLFKGGKEFRTVWSDYSHKLSHLAGVNFDVLLASKNAAEGMMYEAICRTERLNQGLISTEAVAEVPIDENDILSYCEMQKIVKACKEASTHMSHQWFNWSNVPIEYVKSSPYLLSFMDSYELKKQIEAIYRSGVSGLPEPTDRVLLRRKDLDCFHQIPMRNARMKYLSDLMMGHGGSAAMLLWVPASRPYYTTNLDNPFAKNKDFSKALVFSAWEMVPRMISTLMTYEVERKVIFSKRKKAGYDSKAGRDRLKPVAKEIIKYPSKFLSELYTPKEKYGLPLDEIKADIKNRIEAKLEGIPTSNRNNYAKILSVIEWLDNPDHILPDEIPANTAEFLTNMAIGSPGVCLYRILKNDEQVKQIAENFTTIFNWRISGHIIDKLQNKYNKDDAYLDGVMNYCVMGNLQAVLDEYAHMISPENDPEKIASQMSEAFIDVSNLHVDTDESFAGKGNKFAMRISYAVPFAKAKNGANEKTEQRSNNIRTAFQSPFYPFVLTTTSVGQEGLDFHWYCRKIVHWNLPSNPQDLEQREGRINRYKCLAIRRNLSKFDTESKTWKDLFEKAADHVKSEFADKYCGMVPNWCLPPEWIERNKNSIERIERIVPQYPMSNDIDRYRRLKDVLSLYRLTLGQPRQEELLEMLDALQLDPQQINKLLFNLSPISRKNKHGNENCDNNTRNA
ncbi:MAG: helicase C-terminal domain-containing protein [Bacteroides sp.]|nr:helicase C-terminal domain-containing protein [Bacteroides sp.]